MAQGSSPKMAASLLMVPPPKLNAMDAMIQDALLALDDLDIPLPELSGASAVLTRGVSKSDLGRRPTMRLDAIR